MNSAPHPKTIWQNGIIVRVFSVYLAVGFFAWTQNLIILFAAFVVMVELVCIWLYCRAERDPLQADVYILSYLSVGDIVWFLAGIGFIGCSGTAPFWIYGLAATIWLVVSIAQVYIAASLPFSSSAEIGRAGKIAEIKASSAKNLKAIDFIASKLIPAILICSSLAGVIISYLVDQPPTLVIFLGLLFVGLASGFSSVLRPAIIATRIQGKKQSPTAE